MRATKLLALMIFGIAAIFMAPAMTPGQFGKKGGMGWDAGQIFDKLANGRPSIPITELRGPPGAVAQYAQQKGITNGMLNRQQFIEFQDQMKAMRGGGKGGFPRPGGGGPPPNVTIIQNQASNPDIINQWSDDEFRRKDKNGDGKLNQDEMGGFLRANLAKFDKNGDGLIDMYEYRQYFVARNSGSLRDDGGTRGIASIIIEEDELDRKPVVFRAGGQMPAGLPDWFMKFDTDGDGQVALYEWRKGGKPLDEFKDWDLNDDGFITPEEAIKCLAMKGAKGSSNSGAPSLSTAYNGDRPSMNGKGGDGTGKKKFRGPK